MTALCERCGPLQELQHRHEGGGEREPLRRGLPKLGFEIVNEKRRWPILDGRVKRTDLDVVGISACGPDADDADSDDETDVAGAAAGAKRNKTTGPTT